MSKSFDPNQKTALVTGANRGIGKAIVEELLSRGAKKVYLGVRQTDSVNDLVAQYKDRVEAVQLDVSNPEDISNLPSTIEEVDILVNNAGVLVGNGIDNEQVETDLETNLNVNLYGVIRLTNKLLPSLKSKSEAALVTVGSVVSFASMPVIASYSISKAAVHSAIQAYRASLADTNVLVSGLYPGPIDTDMAKDFEMDKASPESVAASLLDGLQAGKEYIFPDAMAEQAGSTFLSSPTDVEKMFSEFK